MARIEPQKPDQTFNRSREFQREVLAYLKEHGLQPYDVLFVHFDPNRTGEIQAVLHELPAWSGETRIGSNLCLNSPYNCNTSSSRVSVSLPFGSTPRMG